MQQLAEQDYFTNFAILKEPYDYFEAVREKGPVARVGQRGIVVVTGFDHAVEVLRDTENYSSVSAPQGPTVPLPFAPEGDDITAQIEAHRGGFGGGDLVVAYDDRQHTFSRSILTRLFTPSKLKANEEYMVALADEMVAKAVAVGRVEAMNGIATRFVTLVISDLLGVPADDREIFMDVIEQGPPAGNLENTDKPFQATTLEFMGRYFARYILERRAAPRDDVLSELANATYPDGSLPDPFEIVRMATFLFAAGQDTSAKLFGNALRYIVDVEGLQGQLRADTSLIPAFLEEVLRLEGSTKVTTRLARKKTTLGDLDIPAGQPVLISFAAANRDPVRWDDPTELRIGRPKIKEHLAFGRGAHVCVGAPLARAEVRVLIERLFAHTANIGVSEAKHGPKGQRHFEYEPTFIIRGLEELHITLDPISQVAI